VCWVYCNRHKPKMAHCKNHPMVDKSTLNSVNLPSQHSPQHNSLHNTAHWQHCTLPSCATGIMAFIG